MSHRALTVSESGCKIGDRVRIIGEVADPSNICKTRYIGLHATIASHPHRGRVRIKFDTPHPGGAYRSQPGEGARDYKTDWLRLV